MKKSIFYMVALSSMFLLAACGGESSSSTGGTDGITDDDRTPPKTYTQSVSLPATAGEQVVTLSDLNSAISSVSGASSWLVVSPQFYSSGAPTLKLEYQENVGTTARSCTVTASASSGEKVVLTITQQSENEDDGNGIDNIHNETTDQPAYAPRKY